MGWAASLLATDGIGSAVELVLSEVKEREEFLILGRLFWDFRNLRLS